MPPPIRCPHCGRVSPEHPGYQTAAGALVFECVRCAKEFTVQPAAKAA